MENIKQLKQLYEDIISFPHQSKYNREYPPPPPSPSPYRARNSTRKRFDVAGQNSSSLEPVSLENCLSSRIKFDSEKAGNPPRRYSVAGLSSRSIVIYRLIRLHLEKTSAVSERALLHREPPSRIRGPRRIILREIEERTGRRQPTIPTS